MLIPQPALVERARSPPHRAWMLVDAVSIPERVREAVAVSIDPKAGRMEELSHHYRAPRLGVGTPLPIRRTGRASPPPFVSSPRDW